MATSRLRAALSLSENIVLRVAVHYGVLLLAGLLVWPRLPVAVRQALLDSYAPNLASTESLPFGLPGDGARVPNAAGAVPRTSGPLAVAGAVIAAFLLSLPVAWVYMLTRERKGYRQTVVHTLVLLPVVVAGVVVLVKSSLALAFSLAGIVAAVRFRNSLDDSKDAVFLFLATGVGLAAGVEIDLAIVISVLFNVATLALFYTDFARTPPGLEGERAQRQLERAMAIANRTSQFVARIDDEVLRALGPAQLDALAGRVRERRKDTAPDLPSTLETEYDARVDIVTTDADATRLLVEPVLAERVKRWQRAPLDGSAASDGDPVVAYHVRWKKGSSPTDVDGVLTALRDRGAPFVVRAEVVR